ncbi:putative bifunctional diguanylate cyclase/phosphodiesterase [Stutzerimonas stutzeri]|uniref:putative bifunctional diguanylate cyclase/phosphodiesterase n=1 Tax=Stutzerimonas stutzeri TaxID=316 RepID=UPI00210AD92A|nr:EAL domain-containing protein [Stutzerimonas stutzeri]
MIRRFLSSPMFPQALLLSLCIATLAFLWGSYWHHGQTSRRAALQAKAAEHLSLARSAAENLRQHVDRVRVIGNLMLSDSFSSDDQRLARMLAEEPTLKRLNLYDLNGRLLNASPPGTQPLPEQWLAEFRAHIAQQGNTPFLPLMASRQAAEPASWRLPFLIPLTSPDSIELERILLVQLDVSPLAVLLNYADLGDTGLVRLLDRADEERLRFTNGGMTATGKRLRPGLPAAPDAGMPAHYSIGQEYQSLYSRARDSGFSVVVSQQVDEILEAHTRSFGRQLWVNLGMTLLILGGVIWAMRLLQRRHEAFCALEQAHRIDQERISRLEDEHRRSTHAAATDHLSGLHNRRQFLDICAETLARQRNRRRLMAVLFIDMDRFKSINDSLGHKVGDLLLQAVAGRISRALESGDQAARFGGDEFVVLLAGDRSEEQIDTWVRELVNKLTAVYALDEHEVNTSPSIGVSICPRDGQEVDGLIRCADAAMYSAKQSGRGQYRFFDPSLNLTDINEFSLEQSLVAALSERQFVLHYQPQIQLDSMQVSGYEALVRWEHPQFGLLYPDRFISLAERSGFIVALGWEVIRLALEELKGWRRQGRSSRLAVNVSAIQLRQADFSDRLLNELAQRGIEAWQFELEITETVVLDDEGMAVEHLERLRVAGLSISLDDFGRGYAGFAHLHSMPLNTLKIDRALIAPLSNSYDDNPIVSSTITLAKRLGLTVVAEGVETRDQLVYLKLAGCDIAQGYHFSRPMSAEQLYQYAPFTRTAEPVGG